MVSREEAVMKIKAAVDARRESGSDIVIVARSDARQAVSLEEALVRSRAFADAGADVLFIDALASREVMKAFCNVSPFVPKMVPTFLFPFLLLLVGSLATLLGIICFFSLFRPICLKEVARHRYLILWSLKMLVLRLLCIHFP